MDSLYCPECARVKKLDTVIRIRTCQDCGVEFFGGPRARRCPDCAYLAKKRTEKMHKKNGTKKPLGSIDKCVLCGKDYVVVSGRQKYCSNLCQRKGILEWQRERKSEYNKKTGQNAKKKENRKKSKKKCVYCGKNFSSDSSTNLCSDYCRDQQKKLRQCIADVNRGYNRDLKKYEKMRDEYREKVKNEDKGI